MYLKPGKNGAIMCSRNSKARLAVCGIHDAKEGIWLVLSTDREGLEVRVTPTGFLRIGKVKAADRIFTPTEQGADDD